MPVAALLVLTAGSGAACDGGRGPAPGQAATRGMNAAASAPYAAPYAAATAASAAAGAAPTPTPVPRRIVSLAPSVTELVFAVGAGDRLVGATSACDYPAAARAVPRVGDYASPSVEVVLSLAPDLVLVPAEGTLRGPYEMLRARRVRVEPIWVRSLEELFSACKRVGRFVGESTRGLALARSLRERVAAVEARVAERPRPRVLVVVDQRPLIAAGPGTFLDELLRAAGGQNALRGRPGSWPQLGREAVLSLRPDVVIDAGMVTSTDPGARPAWAPAAARVVRIDPDLLVRPGPRLIDGLEALSRALHPERR